MKCHIWCMIVDLLTNIYEYIGFSMPLLLHIYSTSLCVGRKFICQKLPKKNSILDLQVHYFPKGSTINHLGEGVVQIEEKLFRASLKKIKPHGGSQKKNSDRKIWTMPPR